MSDGALGPLVGSFRWCPGFKYIEAGGAYSSGTGVSGTVDPAHRGPGCAISDFAYVIHRSPQVADGDIYDDNRKCVRKLENACDLRYRGRRSKRKGPY